MIRKTGQSRRQSLRTVEIRLRAYVPYGLWKPSPDLPLLRAVLGGPLFLALYAIRFSGDSDQGTSRLDLPVTVRVNPADMSVSEITDTGFFGPAEVYAFTDAEVSAKAFHPGRNGRRRARVPFRVSLQRSRVPPLT